MYMIAYLLDFHSLSGVSYNSPNFSDLSDSIETLNCSLGPQQQDQRSSSTVSPNSLSEPQHWHIEV